MSLLITGIRLQRKKTNRPELKAEGTIIFNNCIQVKRVNIIEITGRPIFLEMPSVKDFEGHFKNVFFPANSDIRNRIEEIMFSSYYRMLEKNYNFINLLLVNKAVSCFDSQSFDDFEEIIGNQRDKKYDDNILGTISITDIRLRKVLTSDRLVAFASVVLDDSFIMSDMKVIHNQLNDSYILSMPTYQAKNNQYHELFHPLNKTFRISLEKLVLDALLKMNAENATSFSANVVVSNDITEQKLDDFECSWRILDNTEKVQKKSVDIPKLENLDDEREEIFYNNPGSIFRECLDISQHIVFGKIVSYSENGQYNVRLNNGERGVVSTAELNSLHKVVDYQNYTLATYKTRPLTELDPILKHIGIEYAFKVVNKKGDSTDLLGFSDVKKEYLKYLVENQIIIKGIIVEIDNTHVSIEIPFGYVFITTPVRLFGYKCDDTFVYNDYLNCIVSIVLEYDKDHNRIYPVPYNQKCGIVAYNGKYVFPYIYTWQLWSRNTKLWLDKPLVLNDKHEKYRQKTIGEFFVVSNLRDKGPNNKLYKGNIKYRVDEETTLEKVKRHIFAVQWLVNLKGHTISDAKNYLETKGFVWEIEYVYSQKFEKDRVMSMEPNLQVKTIVPCNTIIRLKVSKGAKNTYVIPNFIGMHVNEARKELHKHNIKSNVTYSGVLVENISENSVLETIPAGGSIRYNDQTVELIVYSSQRWSLPFELLETDTLINTSKTIMICNAAAFENMISMSWKKDIIVFLLMHKLAVSKDLISLTQLLHPNDFKYNRIINFLDKLQEFGLVDTYKISDNVRRMNTNFYVPTKVLYDLAKSQMGYRDNYRRPQLSTTFFKTRASENIAFLKLVELLGRSSLPEYKVDWFNTINPTEDVGRIRIHFAVHSQINVRNHIYILESIRRIDEEAINKIERYQQMFSFEDNLPVTLILIFPELSYKEEFFESTYNNIYFDNIQVLSTTDKLVCDDSLTDFDAVFMKEERLCKIIY